MTDDEIEECTSLREAVNYLRAKEARPDLTLEEFRKSYSLPAGLKEMCDLSFTIMVAAAIATAVATALIGGKEVR